MSEDIGGDIKAALADITGLSVFSNLKKNPLVKAFADLLAQVNPLCVDIAPVTARGKVAALPAGSEASFDLCSCWAAFTAAFIRYAKNKSFYNYLAFLTLTDDNPFTRIAESSGADNAALPPLLKAATAADLDSLGRIAAFDLAKLGFCIA